jgi:hypothetical protein
LGYVWVWGFGGATSWGVFWAVFWVWAVFVWVLGCGFGCFCSLGAWFWLVVGVGYVGYSLGISVRVGSGFHVCGCVNCRCYAQENIVMCAIGVGEANVAVPAQIIALHVEFGADFPAAGPLPSH